MSNALALVETAVAGLLLYVLVPAATAAINYALRLHISRKGPNTRPTDR